MGTFVVGIDGGASNTTAVVLDQQGKVFGRGHAGSSNFHLVGFDSARTALSSAMEKAVRDTGINLNQVAAATWALAGVGRTEERRLFEQLATELLPDIPVQIEHDAVAALAGGLGSRNGIVLVAGTGMIAYGENEAGDQVRAGGWGHLLDHGSGYDLAQEALRAVVRAGDGSDLPTRLTERILLTLNLASPSDLIGWVYAPDREAAEIAALAPVMLAEAEAGDPVATDIVVHGADALANAVATVADRLGFGKRPCPLALAGSLLTKNDFYREVVTQAVRTRCPGAHPQLPRADAAVGAGLLALEMLGYPLTTNAERPSADESLRMSEQPNVLSQDLDLHTTLEMVGLMHVEDQRAVAAVRPTLPIHR